VVMGEHEIAKAMLDNVAEAALFVERASQEGGAMTSTPALAKPVATG